MKRFTFCLLLSLLLLWTMQGCGRLSRYPRVEELVGGFEHPQDTTRTKLWWFHGETETTREGITADLEAFKREGVGGVVYYDQVHGGAVHALEAFSPHWWEMLCFASQEAERLGLTFEVHVSNGYVAGGPWITPELGMQRLAATDTVIEGGRQVEVALPSPVSAYPVTGEVAVLAFPLRDSFWQGRNYPQTLTLSGDTSAWIKFDFDQPFTARSLTYEARPRGKATTSATNVPAPPSEAFVGTGYRVLPPLGELEVSDDGVHYRTVCSIQPLYRAHSNWKQKTLSFPAVTGRHFRIHLHHWQEPNEINPLLRFGNVTLSARPCVDQWEEKAALYSEYIEGDRTPPYPTNEVIDPSQLTDLTEYTDSTGTLRWNVPEGRWVVMRFVYLPVGSKTKHGRKNLMGLECDKLSAHAAEVQWNHYFKSIADTLALRGGKLQGMAMDSHEAGSQNWTPGFEQEFRQRRGYDLLPYLPVLAGYVVESTEASDEVLYDVRRTVADLVSYRYYGTLQRLCREHGYTFTAQATGNALCLVADQLQAKGQVQKPQGEFWAIHPDGNYDIKESSSAAHLYGKPIASAEAFTDAKFSHSLAYIKQLADYAYCYGINEFVVCASAYQPWSDKIPGNTGGGRHYCLNRNNTYWNYSRGFWDYQARCAYLMRQGQPVVDFCLYLGENAPVKILTHRLPEFPSGYDFDAFTTDALLTRMSGTQKGIVLPDGLTYRMMVLPRNGELSLEALQQIATLVHAGATVYGARPTKMGHRATDAQRQAYDTLVKQLWGEEAAPQGAHVYGRGTVYWGMSLAEAVTQAGMQPDVVLPEARKCYYTHRRMADGDIYLLDNHEDASLEHTFVFRCKGRTAEVWNAVTGERRNIHLTVTADGRSAVHLKLAPREALFVVIGEHASGRNLAWVKECDTENAEELQGDWEVEFDTRWGGPGKVCFQKLTDWTQHPDACIKYYSGRAIYRKTIYVAQNGNEKSVQRKLRFSRLGDVARIWLNGEEVGCVWCSPWELDVTPYLRAGDNELRIEAANSLMNRMVGDSMLPPEKRYTFADTPIATPQDELVPSGIIGAVWLVALD